VYDHGSEGGAEGADFYYRLLRWPTQVGAALRVVLRAVIRNGEVELNITL
jgi:hypothetical protein